MKVEISTLQRNQGREISEAPISLYNKEKLIAKTAVDFSENDNSVIIFDIDNSEAFIGKLEVNDQNLPFDNRLFFSINKPKKINVLAINEADGSFLERLFERTNSILPSKLSKI